MDTVFNPQQIIQAYILDSYILHAGINIVVERVLNCEYTQFIQLSLILNIEVFIFRKRMYVWNLYL